MPPPFMEAFLVSIVVVAVGEIGDKTQLLALMLAARLRKPLPIALGILVATLINHTLAGIVGAWVREVVPAQYLRWLVVASFFAVALWALKPDKLDPETAAPVGHFGAFAITVVAFFLAEMGDKTQIATVVLAAQFGNLVAVVAGTTVGMLLADIPVVLLGNAAAARLPFRRIRYVAAGLFALLGVVAWFAPALS
jgi:putative Ca2+/H+ antiporter (TMEM165/GDT1 family)